MLSRSVQVRLFCDRQIFIRKKEIALFRLWRLEEEKKAITKVWTFLEIKSSRCSEESPAMFPSAQIACSADFGLDAHRQPVRFDKPIELIASFVNFVLPDSNFVKTFSTR